MTQIQAVIFDLGHTLWDYAPTEQSRRLGTLRPSRTQWSAASASCRAS